jgi:myosin heavy subunit
MSTKNDQIFQLSLTEIAFTIAFMLMILLGFMVFQATKDNQMLKDQLSYLEDADKKLVELEKVQDRLNTQLKELNVSNPEEMITKLVDASTAREETARLKQLLLEQDEQITALSKLQKALDEAAKEQGGNLIADDVQKALELAQMAKEHLQGRLDNPDEVLKLDDFEFLKTKAKESFESLQKAEQLLSEDPELAGVEGTGIEDKLVQLSKDRQAFNEMKQSPDNPLVVKKENSDLKGQIQYLKRRLEVRGGLDFPPCWADQNGKVQMLLALDLRDDELTVSKDWPASREEDAWALPNMKAVMEKPITSYDEFVRAVKPISDLSRTQNCRHYVKLRNSIEVAVLSDRRRLMIEDYFYKLEVRR